MLHGEVVWQHTTKQNSILRECLARDGSKVVEDVGPESEGNPVVQDMSPGDWVLRIEGSVVSFDA